MASPTQWNELAQNLGDSGGQGGLSCCSTWVTKSRTRLSDWTTTEVERGLEIEHPNCLSLHRRQPSDGKWLAQSHKRRRVRLEHRSSDSLFRESYSFSPVIHRNSKSKLGTVFFFYFLFFDICFNFLVQECYKKAGFGGVLGLCPTFWCVQLVFTQFNKSVKPTEL